jgi:hypothetical protein
MKNSLPGWVKTKQLELKKKKKKVLTTETIFEKIWLIIKEL